VGQSKDCGASEGVHFLGWDRLWGMRGCEVELLLELVPLALSFFCVLLDLSLA
jgi:hypothetical protein